jgi:NAD(P)-dependent dehydrogenase (short-subunit alcohol dehydrogenase family)
MLRGATVRVVFMSSGAGWAFTPGFGHYNVSKAALNSLAASLAEECGARYPDADMQINVLNPGEARTEMNEQSTRSPFAAAGMTLLLLSHPRGGANGCFFHADGRHLAFGAAAPYPCSLVSGEPMVAPPVPATAGPPLLCGSVAGYNIVRYGGWYYGIPQALGDLHLESDDVAGYPDVIREASKAAVELRLRRLG